MNELLVDRLKSARNEKGMKQLEVADRLGLKANTISNWEKGRTEPDIDTFVKLCDIYSIDCASLLSDVYAFKRVMTDISLAEYDHIKKYRDLNDHGKEMVDFTLMKEWEQSTQNVEKVVPIISKDIDYLKPVAAHTDDTSPENIQAMRDEFDDFDDLP